MGTVDAEVRRSKIISTVAQVGYEEMSDRKSLRPGKIVPFSARVLDIALKSRW